MRSLDTRARRARVVRPNQTPSGWRRCAGMVSSRIAEDTGSRSPALCSASSRPTSTVSTASAGLFAPAALIFSTMPFLANTTFTAMPVCFVNSSSIGSMRNGWRYEYRLTSPAAWAGTATRDAARAARVMRILRMGLVSGCWNENHSRSSGDPYSRFVLRMQAILICIQIAPESRGPGGPAESGTPVRPAEPIEEADARAASRVEVGKSPAGVVRAGACGVVPKHRRRGPERAGRPGQRLRWTQSLRSQRPCSTREWSESR